MPVVDQSSLVTDVQQAMPVAQEAVKLPDPNDPRYAAARARMANLFFAVGREDSRNGYGAMADDLMCGDLMQVPTWIALGMLAEASTPIEGVAASGDVTASLWLERAEHCNPILPTRGSPMFEAVANEMEEYAERKLARLMASLKSGEGSDEYYRDDEPLPPEAVARIDASWEKYKTALNRCDVPPEGWYCTRSAGHDGPCAALSTPPATSPEGASGDGVELREAIARVIGKHGAALPWHWHADFDDGEDKTAERLRNEDRAAADDVLAVLPDAIQTREAETFEDAWAEKEEIGFHYGEDALENVRMGWDMARAALNALPCKPSGQVVESPNAALNARGGCAQPAISEQLRTNASSSSEDGA